MCDHVANKSSDRFESLARTRQRWVEHVLAEKIAIRPLVDLRTLESKTLQAPLQCGVELRGCFDFFLHGFLLQLRHWSFGQSKSRVIHIDKQVRDRRTLIYTKEADDRSQCKSQGIVAIQM